MNRGDVVRPTADAIARTGYRESSRLVVSLARTRNVCVACVKEWAERRPNAGSTVWWGEARIRAGSLYGRGQETSSALCLTHVEPIEEGSR